MFFKNYYPTIVKNTKKYELSCPFCGNKNPHQIYEFYDGFCVGFIFLKKPLIATKKYFLVCPICNNPTKELTLGEVHNSKGEGIIKEDTQKNVKNFCKNCGAIAKKNYVFCKHCGLRL